VVVRDDHELTATEVKQHWDEIVSSTLAALQTWADMKCFSRKKRVGAKNIIDCKFVRQWKEDTVAVKADSS
jgi:hypothetical protein